MINGLLPKSGMRNPSAEMRSSASASFRGDGELRKSKLKSFGTLENLLEGGILGSISMKEASSEASKEVLQDDL